MIPDHSRIDLKLHVLQKGEQKQNLSHGFDGEIILPSPSIRTVKVNHLRIVFLIDRVSGSEIIVYDILILRIMITGHTNPS